MTIDCLILSLVTYLRVLRALPVKFDLDKTTEIIGNLSLTLGQ